MAAYPNLDALQRDSDFERLGTYDLSPRLASAVFASEFAVPAALDHRPQGFAQELDVLQEALEVSSKKAYVRNRRAYWRWLRELRDGVITDVAAVAEAAEEL